MTTATTTTGVDATVVVAVAISECSGNNEVDFHLKLTTAMKYESEKNKK